MQTWRPLPGAWYHLPGELLGLSATEQAQLEAEDVV
jgi:hypothetical protein